jgi:HTH-type transcriptional regulator, transcriptional repressor of NAD biosynthesis genes
MDGGAAQGGGMKRGFFLGKFMPPHAGHASLIEAARRLVDEMTVLVCWLPGDPINGELRLKWMQQLFPDCRVIGHGAIVPQYPWDSEDFWPIWRGIVRQVHPEPIDYVFAGEDYGADLAREVGGLFVPLGGRVLGADSDPIGGLTATAIRANPAAHWPLLPQPVQQYYQKRVCLHGSESTGKSTLSAQLASHYDTLAVGEYGRSHCEAHPEELTADDLMLIGKAQHAMIDAAAPWAGPLLLSDTDALMTAAWSEMLLGTRIEALMHFPKADLYLLMEPDIPWVDDGTRYFASDAERRKFCALVERILADANVPFQRISGSWAQREAQARAMIDSLLVMQPT